jgi:thiamine pyrophosphate-dependent acetolactate synthase large subunit-like protein
MVKWEQTYMLSTPEFGVGFSSIDFAGFAKNCGGKGYTIREPFEISPTLNLAMKEKKPTIIEVYIDQHEMPSLTK